MDELNNNAQNVEQSQTPVPAGNGKGVVIAAFVISLVSIVFAVVTFCISYVPVFGIIFGIVGTIMGVVGLVLAVKGKKKADSSDKGKCTAAIVLSIIAICFSVIGFGCSTCTTACTAAVADSTTEDELESVLSSVGDELESIANEN